MSYKILFIGEIVGKFGVYAVRKGIKQLKEKHGIEFVIANANGATGGFGMGKNHAIALKNAGVDVLTGGDYTFFKKDLVDFLPKTSFVLRPANYTPKTPGKGWGIYKFNDKKIGVINLLGPSGINRNHPSNPFTYVESLIEKVKSMSDIVIINFHSKTTAEKQLMYHIVDGKCQALIGSGSKSITSDVKVSDKKTAYITDTGRTGSSTAPGGLSGDIEIEKLITGIPKRSKDINKDLELQGVIITFNDKNEPISNELVRLPIKREENA
ncbi:YmdB family metallophosphoesterase [Thiospirochaeta perfilievii]|uniref:YmdB family metallophosphoesterase n=1 Tax=Thiospirochaeta perfilievii TaxID=252967 RepID=A0A5C1QF62_9SPIO|nr:TIGR00282 family metallophosphoesterase [Thiospirochaeta perfilievii]QEN04822.1 YmdB family metallophosphoesterase [Thiospirochaeta perfilievii]